MIDYDSTLADTSNHRLAWVNAHFGTNYQQSGVTHWHNADSNYLTEEHEAWQWGPDCFMDAFFQETAPPVPYAIESMLDLMEMGHKPMVVSDRPIGLFDVTREWLDQQGLDMVRLLFTRHKHSLSTVTEGMRTKLQATYQHRLTHVVEDAPHHALALATKPYVERVYLLDKPYNQEVIHKKVLRVQDWREIITHLREEA